MTYLDHNATSPLLPEVLDAMRPWFGVPANASSHHRAGQAAAAALERVREDVAALVNGDPDGVIFTSGATEANYLFISGARRRAGRDRWWASELEHPCVKAAIGSDGVGRLPVTHDGIVAIPDLPDDLVGLSLMAANHETGVIQPLAIAREAARRVGAALHVDATQAAGRIPLDLSWADGVVLSGHKLGGPSGTGALIVPDGEPFPALFGGGGQERGRRSGTVNTVGAVGLAAACRVARRDLADRIDRWNGLRADLERGLTSLGGRIVGANAPRIANTTSVIFAGLRAETLVQALDLQGICVSAGAACSSGSLEPSPVLRAMGDPEPEGGVRISMGPLTDHAETQALLRQLPQVLDLARQAQAWDAT